MNAFEKSASIKISCGKAFRTAVPKWRDVSVTDTLVAQMASW